MRIRYHHPIPNFYKVDNPTNHLNIASDDFLDNLKEYILSQDFIGVSYSRLSDDFKKEWSIGWDNFKICNV